MARTAQAALVVVLVVSAILVNAVVFGPLTLPGAPPNALVIIVAALALVFGPTPGAFIGFLAGLAADVLPPSDHLIGRYALVMCLAGYLVGLLRDEARDSVLVALVSVAGAAAVTTVLYEMLGLVLDDGRSGFHSLLTSVPYSIAYDVLLTPFIVPWVMSVMRRLEARVVVK